MSFLDPVGGQIISAPARSVGLFSAQLPRELLYALGCIPVRVFPTAAKPTAAEAYLPRNFCTLNRLILASFVENGDSSLDAVIFSDEDDAVRRLCDVWRACVRVPVWGFIEVPRVTGSLAAKRYTDNLARLASELETHTGRVLNPVDLLKSIGVYNRQKHLLNELQKEWLERSVSTNLYRRLRRSALTLDPVMVNQQLERTLAELQAGTQRDAPAAADFRVLLLSELAAPAGLVRLMEAQGARVVAEDSDLDEQNLPRPVPAEGETVEGLLLDLANAYLSKPPGPRMRDLPRRMAHLTQLIKERNAQAAICAYSRFCDLYLTEFPILKAHLSDVGVSTLLLELEDDGISGQHRTRVEAFLEMLRGD